MSGPHVHLERTGGSGPRVLLLHGAGATAAVWAPTLAEIARRRAGWDVLTVDLPGHGRSDPLPGYHHQRYAEAVARAVPPGRRIDLAVGHSLGGLVALSLADGTHGIEIGAVAVLALRVGWTADELAARAGRAARPSRIFAAPEPARSRFALVSGMAADADPELLDTGVLTCDGGFRLAVDPRTGADPPADADELARVAARAAGPVRLACGGADPGVRPDELSATLGHPVQVVPGAGHNLHVEHPSFVVDLIENALPA
ncbi:alpha/beta hydrolase [Pseudonocardia sp. NPDC046786]|uniref:alpha/beta fold hydrolase n=1 Tax=Pseudonocardia sp. NPDC046786 TaxID=3155471 RepID=UPI0033E85630